MIDEDEFTHLEKGWPGVHILTEVAEIIKTSTIERITTEIENPKCLGYAPFGNHYFLEQLGKFLTEHYGKDVHKENLLQTCGSTSGLTLILNALFNPAKDIVVYVEDPTYFLGLRLFRDDFHLKIESIPMTEKGMDTRILEERILENEANGRPYNNGSFSGLIYTIPVLHNPTGMVLHKDTTKMMHTLARRHNLLIVCDDVYNLLNYQGSHSISTHHHLFAEDDASGEERYSENIISNGSVSKILAPGLRLGWLEASANIIKKIGSTIIVYGGATTSNAMSAIVGRAMESGRHSSLIRKIRKELATKSDLICSYLEENLPRDCKLTRPLGGYYIWIELPENGDSQEFATFLQNNYKIKILPGLLCSGGKSSKSKRGFRICIAYYDVQVLKECASKICKAVHEYLNNNN